nr:immunoglobulin light chain junction region [Macaca mulatta]MOW56390.1 immunoglobulin light chain junction region [Macaca mulatta]MOW56760.1 immunoglobulin light chain junction region [Macaca mulatta]MOW56860.1 immunoglobulin light chain junction region [Macaca mulatta]MOW57116.1 immunoglobulin light chain junction region [Macaca mulatta]
DYYCSAWDSSLRTLF